MAYWSRPYSQQTRMQTPHEDIKKIGKLKRFGQGVKSFASVAKRTGETVIAAPIVASKAIVQTPISASRVALTALKQSPKLLGQYSKLSLASMKKGLGFNATKVNASISRREARLNKTLNKIRRSGKKAGTNIAGTITKTISRIKEGKTTFAPLQPSTYFSGIKFKSEKTKNNNKYKTLKQNISKVSAPSAFGRFGRTLKASIGLSSSKELSNYKTNEENFEKIKIAEENFNKTYQIPPNETDNGYNNYILLKSRIEKLKDKLKQSKTETLVRLKKKLDNSKNFMENMENNKDFKKYKVKELPTNTQIEYVSGRITEIKENLDKETDWIKRDKLAQKYNNYVSYYNLLKIKDVLQQNQPNQLNQPNY
jgi:hypothetical protein